MADQTAGGVRIDKWLWCARLYKTRALAAQGCRKNEVQLDGASVKASRLLVGEEQISVQRTDFHKIVKVVELLKKRVGAELAVQAYVDLTPVPDPRSKPLQQIKSGVREKGSGRPTKRDRRLIDKLRRDGGSF